MPDLPGSAGDANQPTGNTDLGWRAALPDDLKENEVLSAYSNIGDVSKDFISLKEKSANALYKPGENATEDDRQAFKKSINELLGVPDTVEGYEIPKPDNLPEGMEIDDVLTDRMLNTLHKSGAPKELVQSLLKDFNDYNVELHTKFNEYVKENSEKDLNALKDLWKGDFEKKNSETFEVLNKVAEKINIPDSIGGMKGFLEDIENLGLKNNPRMNVFFNSMFDLIGIDEVIKGSGGAGAGSGNVLDEMFPDMKT